MIFIGLAVSGYLMSRKEQTMRQNCILPVLLCMTAIVLPSVFTLCIHGSSQEKTGREEVKEMTEEVGWAEPQYIISQPRVQKVGGFLYLYVEEKHVKESEGGPVISTLIGKAHDACRKAFGRKVGNLVIMHLILPKETESMYDIQVGFALSGDADVTPAGEAKVRYVEPALCAAILIWGTVDDIIKSFSPLSEFMNEKGLKGSDVGWREWTLYNDNTKNAIFLQQRVLEEE
jgi:hypothetical protein